MLFQSRSLPEGDWLYEIKFDGFRALAFKDSKDVRLISRNKKAFDYPRLLDAIKKLPAGRLILDGEITALDEQGRSSFQLLQMFKSSGDVPLLYYAFDLLCLEDKDLRREPLSARRKLLANLLKKPPEHIRLSDELRGNKDDLLRVARSLASRAWSPKNEIRFTKAPGASALGSNSRSPSLRSSLSAATRCLKETGNTSALCWLATTVRMDLCSPVEFGTGFSEKLLASIDAQLLKIRRTTCPFVNLPEKTKGRWGLGITPAVMKRCHWVKPVLVAQDKFTEWTLDDQLRQPVFLGLRSDKKPEKVVRE
jgi:bifunctional non-homologous end joining protein LigD